MLSDSQEFLMFHHKPILAFIGTYPPRECGIATFTRDLLQSSKTFLGPAISCKVAALNFSPLDHFVYPPEVAWEISQENQAEYAQLAKNLNENPNVSGVIVQHEYGIYGGHEGEYILSLLENCNKPILVTLHTVLPHPSEKMREVTSRIIKRSNSIVVLTKSSQAILAQLYPFSIGKVTVIPHGIHDTPFSSPEKAKKKLKLTGSTVLTTFGLLSRGKGIEYVIAALPEIIKKHPTVLYLILGQTHPAVRRAEGEKYRLELAALVTKLDLKNNVKFYDQYLDLEDLLEFLRATDMYISTSINPNQAVSGTLSYALGTGRAVVSTSFAQAKEIISPENGRLVPVRDTPAIAAAVEGILCDPNQLALMHQHAYESTRSMVWSQVAKEYSDLLTQLVIPPINLSHLKKMTDEFGLFQFAVLSTPHKEFGYTLDDNARALVVCSWLGQLGYKHASIKSLGKKYLRLIEFCQKKDGTFENYVEFDHKKFTSQNTTEDISDATARAVWGLSEVIKNPAQSATAIETSKKILLRVLPHLVAIPHLRSKAFMIKALVPLVALLPSQAAELRQLIEQLSISLEAALAQHTDADLQWHWFENQLSYNNALLSESLIIAGSFLKKEEMIASGFSSLQFLIDQTFSTNQYTPIGHSDWYVRGKNRSEFDQQPEEPSAMILALCTAYRHTGHQSYKNLAHKCFSWFLGNNSLHISLYDYKTGGCHDGLHPDRVNQNQGAESLLSYLLSRLAISEIDRYEHSTDS